MANGDSKSSIKAESLVEVGSDYTLALDNDALNGLHTDDDPNLNPWTFRMFLIGTYKSSR